MKLYVNGVEIGYYWTGMSDNEIELKQLIYKETSGGNGIDIIQEYYYWRDFANFITIYRYQDGDIGSVDFYLIDSGIFESEDNERYDAVKLGEDIDVKKFFIANM